MDNKCTTNGSEPAVSAFWNGESLGEQTIAIHVFSSATPTHRSELRLALIAAARTDAAYVLIHPSDLGRFVLKHPDRVFACANAIALHNSFVTALQNDPDKSAISTWWKTIRESHLHGCGILAELVDRAHGRPLRPAYDLQTMAGRHGQRPVPPIDAIEQDLLRAAGSCGDQLDVDLSMRISGVIEAIFSVHRALMGEAKSLIDEYAIPEDVVKRHGPLALGVHVQGAIAINRMNERRLRIDTNRTLAVRKLLKQRLRDCEEILRKNTDVASRFRVQEGALKPLDGHKGTVHAQLAEWTDALARDVVGPHGVPLPRPADWEGGASSRSDEWRTHRRCSEAMSTWTRMRAVSRCLDDLEKIDRDPSFGVSYVLEPGIESSPSQQRLEQLGNVGLFIPKDGHGFAMLSFRDLDLAALAACCATCGKGELAQACREEPDLVSFIISQLQRRPACFSSRNSGSESEVIRVALEAMALRLGMETARKLAKVSYDVEISESELRQVCDRLRELYPDLAEYCKEDLPKIVAKNLSIDSERISARFDSQWSTTDFHLALSGNRRRTDDELIIAVLRGVNRNRELDELLREAFGSGALYTACLRSRYISSIGRMSGPEVFSEACAPHLNLADDAVKAALFEVVASGYRILGWMNGKVVVELAHDHANEKAVERIANLARCGAERVLRCVPIQIGHELVERC